MTGKFRADAKGGPSLRVLAHVDACMSRHPRLMFIATIVGAVIATLVLLAQRQGAVVLYQAF
jgi:hypothetical protein